MTEPDVNSSRRGFLKSSLGASTAMGAGALIALAADESTAAGDVPPRAPSDAKKSPRIIYNDDGDSVVTIPHQVPMTVHQLTDLIDQFAGTQVDRYVYCLGNGRVAHHETRVADPYWDVKGGKYEKHTQFRLGENVRHLVQSGFDPPATLGNRAREVGMEFYLCLRMNDAHFAYSKEGPENAHTAGSFWHKHPEFRLGGNTPHYSRHLFDYSHAQVREFRLAYIEECCRKYTIDGFELDFMRHPFYFPPNQASTKNGVMTEFVRSVRKLLDTIGKEKGVAIPLQVIVPRTLKAGLQAGLDVASWIQERLVSAIVPKHFIQFNMEVPVEQFQTLTEGTAVQVYPCIEQRGHAGAGEDWILHPDAKFRAAASRYWSAKVDGLYLYNYFNHRPHPLCQADRQVLQEIGDPALIHRRDKHYFLASAETEVRRHFLLTGTTDLAGEDRQVPQPLDTQPDGHATTLIIGDDIVSARQQGLLKRVTLRIGVPGILPEGDRWDIQLNGQVIPHDQQLCVADPVAFSERWIDIDLTDGPDPTPGKNEIRFILHQRHPLVRLPPDLTNVELLVEYN